MHYYQFNIGDYAAHTRHLSLLEDLAYRRLLDLYYSSEKPLISDTKKLARLLSMPVNEPEIKQVLEDFFILSDVGYIQNRVNDEIDKYHSKADSARANGKKGGRPKKPITNPEETHPVNSANPEESGSKAKQETLNNNHEQGTIKQEQETVNKVEDTSVPAKPKPLPKFEINDLVFAEEMYKRLLVINPNHKQPNLEAWANDIRITRERDSRSLDDLWNAFDWANKDSFWCKNILSPSKLREQFDKLSLQMVAPPRIGNGQQKVDPNNLTPHSGKW